MEKVRTFATGFGWKTMPAQLMSFFEQEKDNLPKDLTKEFFKMLTLLGHGPAGENGACLAFDTPQSLEVIEYTKTLANGDIVTTKKLGSKTNLDGFGGEIDKINASNQPKEEDEKNEGDAAKSEGDDAKKGEGGDAKEGEGDAAKKGEGEAAKEGEGADAKKTEGAAAKKTEGADAKKAPAAKAPAPAPAKSAASQKQAATAIAIAAISAAEANSDKQPTDTVLLKDIPKEPIPPSEEVKAINELYKNDKTKRKSKIETILRLKKHFNEKLNKLVTLLRDIFNNSIKSISNSTNKKNMYVGTSEYKGKIAEIEGLVEEIKDDPDYKIIKDYPDKITSELKVSKLWKDDNEKKLLAKIDKLFYIYSNVWKLSNSAYDYFKKYKYMKDSMMAVNDSALEIGARFRKELTNMERYISDLNKDASDTAIIEQQLMTSN